MSQLLVHPISYVKTGLIKSPQRLKWCLAGFIAVCAGYALLRHNPPGFSHSEAQYIILPFLLMLFLALSPGRKIVNYFVAGASLICASLLAFFLFTTVPLQLSEFVISRFEGDDFDMKSSLFREHIENRISGESELRTGRLLRVVKSNREAQQLLKNGKATALIWGNSGWVNMTFQKNLNTEPLPIKIQKKTFELVRFVPAIGVSFKEAFPAADFVSLLLLSEHQTREVAESYLKSAALYVSTWSTFAHLAYPYWKLGNSHLEAYLARGRTEPAELLCAIEAYSRGASRLQDGDNPHLRAALFANKAVALLLMNGLNGESKRESKAMLKKAKEFASRKDPFGARANMHKTISHNLELLNTKKKKSD